MKENENKQVVFWLFEQTKKYLWGLVLLIILSFFIGGLSSYTAIQSKLVIDSLTKYRGVFTQEVTRTIVMYVLLILLLLGLNYTFGVLNDSLKARLTMTMQKQLTNSLMMSPYSKTKNLHTGKISTYLYSDIPYVANGILTIAPHFVNMSTRLGSAILFLFLLDKQLATVLMLFGCSLVFTVTFARKYSQKLYRIIQEKNAKTRAFIQDSMANILAIQIFQRAPQIQSKIEWLQKNEYQAIMKRSYLSQLNSIGFSLVYQASYIGVLIWGGYRIAKGSLTLGSLTALIQLSAQIQAPIANIAGLVPVFWGVITSSNRIMNLSQENQSELPKEVTPLPVGDMSRIVATNLNFSYDQKQVIMDTSFMIEKGEIVAFTGESGSGKTTLMMLLMGIIGSTQIQILTKDGKALHPNNTEGHLFSFVPQKELLFEGTVRENITFFQEDIEEERVLQAAKIADAHKFITELDTGYDSLISENGKGLSQGQAQRIAIARAVYSDAEILVLDEATSALDRDTERKVLLNIAALNKTVIMITHRMDTLKYANKRYHVEKGRVNHVQL